MNQFLGQLQLSQERAVVVNRIQSLFRLNQGHMEAESSELPDLMKVLLEPGSSGQILAASQNRSQTEEVYLGRFSCQIAQRLIDENQDCASAILKGYPPSALKALLDEEASRPDAQIPNVFKSMVREVSRGMEPVQRPAFTESPPQRPLEGVLSGGRGSRVGKSVRAARREVSSNPPPDATNLMRRVLAEMLLRLPDLDQAPPTRKVIFKALDHIDGRGAYSFRSIGETPALPRALSFFYEELERYGDDRSKKRLACLLKMVLDHLCREHGDAFDSIFYQITSEEERNAISSRLHEFPKSWARRFNQRQEAGRWTD